MMEGSIEVCIAGIKLRLLPDRGAYWSDQQTLFVADTHFGKEATFRRHSIPVPRGSTDGTLRRISRMVSATSAAKLVILGDMFHARSSLSKDVVDSLQQFFADHEGLRLIRVPGNHDANIGRLPDHWPIENVREAERIDSVAVGHHPVDVPAGANLLLCGHLHPAVHVGTGDERMRLPCFWLSKRRLVFPAIGEFTGTHPVAIRGNDRAWAIADDQVIEHRRQHQ